MKCSYCKGKNPKGRTICISCGGLLESDTEAGEYTDEVTDTDDVSDKASYVVPVHVSDYLVQAILITVCCCLPFGIVAIVYAARVKAFLLGGQIAMAEEASEKAKMWCWVGFGIGIVFYSLYILMNLMAASL